MKIKHAKHSVTQEYYFQSINALIYVISEYKVNMYYFKMEMIFSSNANQIK